MSTTFKPGDRVRVYYGSETMICTLAEHRGNGIWRTGGCQYFHQKQLRKLVKRPRIEYWTILAADGWTRGWENSLDAVKEKMAARNTPATASCIFVKYARRRNEITYCYCVTVFGTPFDHQSSCLLQK